MARGGRAVKRLFGYINVGEIGETFERVQAMAPNSMESTDVIIEGPFRFFRVRDPENTALEFFSIDPAPSESQLGSIQIFDYLRAAIGADATK